MVVARVRVVGTGQVSSLLSGRPKVSGDVSGGIGAMSVALGRNMEVTIVEIEVVEVGGVRVRP